MQDECPTHTDQSIHWTTLAIENHMILMGSAKASQVCVCAWACSCVCVYVHLCVRVCEYICYCVCTYVSMLMCVHFSDCVGSKWYSPLVI